MIPNISRRTFVGGLAATGVGACAPAPLGSFGAAGESAVPVPVNPLVRQRADAQIFRHTDGNYYMTASVPEYDRIVLRRAPTIAGLATAEEAVLWRHSASGPMSGFIWAPELHQIDGRWIMYFAAGPSGGGQDVFRIRTYALVSDSPDPMTGKWEVLGQLQTPWDTFNLDSTTFVHRGVRYLAWAQREPGIETNSNLYLAPLATPLTLAAKPTRLTVPTLPWEVQGFKVAEGPAPLVRNGRFFMTYSASATDARYVMGLLTAREDADLMDPGSWTKSPVPVFVSSPETGVYGPGHNSFTVDEQGRDVLVYHGRDYEKIQGDPLLDPNRHTRVQRVYFHPDGTPDFGIPVGNGEVPDRFSPVNQPNAFLLLSGARVTVGAGPLPATQFRQKQGLAGPGTVSLEPITAPGRFLVRGPDNVLVLADRENSADFARRSSFQRRSGLADRRGSSFAAVGAEGSWLHHSGGAIRVGPLRDASDRAGATFILS